jgi:DNA-directed RNA polymerase sigma subunit (sigma70/sigma32)
MTEEQRRTARGKFRQTVPLGRGFRANAVGGAWAHCKREENLISLVDAVISDRLCDRTHRAFSLLTPRQALLLSMRFGLGAWDRRPLAEISKLFAMPPEQILEIEEDALRRLRRAGSSPTMPR